MQPPPPLQEPPQPAKVDVAPACSLRVTAVPAGTVVLQVPEEQSMPAGEEVTRPAPSPTSVTVTRAVPGDGGGAAVNAAVTSWSALIATSQAPVPEHAPCQPAKLQPASATACRCAVALASSAWVQSLRQENDGFEARICPSPVTCRCSACWAAAGGPPEPGPPSGGACVWPVVVPQANANALANATHPVPRMPAPSGHAPKQAGSWLRGRQWTAARPAADEQAAVSSRRGSSGKPLAAGGDMRSLSSVAAIVLAVACTRSTEPAPPPAPLPEDVAAQLKLPPEAARGQISGMVTKREGGAVMLDSGGPEPIPLRIDDRTKVTLDGQPARGVDVREGDLVRAAYRRDANGEPLALEVVANSRPPQQAPPQQTTQAPPAERTPPPPQPPPGQRLPAK